MYIDRMLKDGYVCTCPSFMVSRFLSCKHLVQVMRRVPPILFLEADWYREPPFWRHPNLKPLEETAAASGKADTRDQAVGDDGDDDDGGDDDDEEENDDYDLEEIWQHDG